MDKWFVILLFGWMGMNLLERVFVPTEEECVCACEEETEEEDTTIYWRG